MIRPRNLDDYDIFSDWRQRRFILADRELYDEEGQLIILTDFGYWTLHFEELMEWCRDNGGKVNGSTVLFQNDHEVTAFVLRWS